MEAVVPFSKYFVFSIIATGLHTMPRLFSGGKPASIRNAIPGYKARRRRRRRKGGTRRPRARPTNTGESEVE